MREIWFSIDNLFKVEVADNASDDEIHEAMYGKLHSVLQDASYGDFDLVIVEETKED